jgi:hypothetical protein
MLIRKLKKIAVSLLVTMLLLGGISRIDVVYGELAKERFDLVAVIADSAVVADADLKSKIERYARDVQSHLPYSKVITLTIDSEVSAQQIQQGLEKLYYEGDGAVNQYNRLKGIVLVGDVPMPVVDNGSEIFPSIFPYVDFYRKAYIYNSASEIFIRNDSVSDPVADVWHGVIKPPVAGAEGIAFLKKYFDKNHAFYSENNPGALFDKRAFFADFYHEKKWLLPEVLVSYQEKIDNLQTSAYSYFTGALAKSLREGREERLVADGFGNVLSNANGGGVASPADRQLLQAGINQARGGANVADIDPNDVEIPDVFSVHMIRAFWKDFYESAQKFVIEANSLIANSGRWSPEDVDTPVSIITLKDTASQQIVYSYSMFFEKLIDSVVGNVQNDVVLIQDVQTPFANTAARVNGTAVADLQSAQDCSLYLGSLEPVGKSQLVEANRVYNPLTAGDTSGFAGCHGRNLNNPGACNPDAATRPVKDVAGTALVTTGVTDDYRQCLERVSIQTPPGGFVNLTYRAIPSVVKHVEPTGETLVAQMRAGFSKYLPIDFNRYTTFQTGALEPARIDYLTSGLWGVSAIDQAEAESAVKNLIAQKNNEISDLIVNQNVQSFKNYIGSRLSNAGQIEERFNSWRTQTLSLLRGYFSDGSDTEIFENYLRNHTQLTGEQKNQLQNVFQTVFGNNANSFDQESSCAEGCDVGSYSSSTHNGINTLHDFFAAGGDNVRVRTVSFSQSPQDGALLRSVTDEKVLSYRSSDLLGRTDFISLVDDEKISQLADALVWKNLGVERKHEYALKNYLGTNLTNLFGANNGYEFSYLVADGDSTGIDISVDRGVSESDDNEFSAVKNSATAQLRDLTKTVRELTSNDKREVDKCPGGSPDGVDLWLWVPYVLCWAQDAITPPFFEFPSDENNPVPQDSVAVPSNVRLTVPTLTMSSSRDASLDVRLEAFDASGKLMTNYSGGSIEFVVSEGDDFATIIGDGKTYLRGGVANMKIYGTGVSGSATVIARAHFDNKDIVSDPLKISTVEQTLKVRAYKADDVTRSTIDEMEVGDIDVVIEVSVTDSDGATLSDVSGKSVTLEISDSKYFSKQPNVSVSLQNGVALFSASTAQLAGSVTLTPKLSDGSASGASFDFPIVAGPPDRIEVTGDAYVTSGIESRYRVKVFDAFDNLVEKQFSVEAQLSGSGSFSGTSSNADRIIILAGQGSVLYKSPELITSPQESIISFRLTDGETEVEKDFSVSLLPKINVTVAPKVSSFSAGGSETAVDITVTNVSGAVLADLDTIITLDVSPSLGGHFSERTVQLKSGKGTATFIPGTTAGKFFVRASHAGFETGSAPIEVRAGSAKLIQLSGDESYYDIFSDRPYVLKASLHDQWRNPISADSQTKITLRSSAKTEGVVSFVPEATVINGSTTFELSDGNGGEAHLIAESPGLISGTFILPLHARLGSDALKSLSSRSLFGTLLGAPIGDVTQPDYLGGWMLDGGKMLAIDTVSRKLSDSQRVATIGQNSFFALNPDVSPVAEFNTLGQDRLDVFDNSGTGLVSIYPFMKETVGVHISSDGFDETKFQTGMNLFLDSGSTLEAKLVNGSNILVGADGKQVMRIAENGDIEISDPLYSLRPVDLGDLHYLSFDLMQGARAVGTLVYKTRFPKTVVTQEVDFTDSGMYIVLKQPSLEARTIRTSSASNSFGYEIVDTQIQTTRTFGFKASGVQDVLDTSGIGWEGDNTFALQFASGSGAGESVQNYLSDIEILLGDPVASLKISRRADPVTNQPTVNFSALDTNSLGFDQTVGRLLHRESDGAIQDLIHFDFNNDSFDDVGVLLTDGTVKLLRGVSGEAPLEPFGALLQFSGNVKTLVAGDFSRDRYDDLVALMSDGTVVMQNNVQKKFTEQKLDLKLDRVMALASDDMDKDNFLDLVASDSRGDVYVFYGSAGGITVPGNRIGELGIKVDTASELNSQAYVYYPGVIQPQFNSASCAQGSLQPECDQRNFLQSSFVPRYSAQQIQTGHDGGADDYFSDSVDQKYAGSLQLAPDNKLLFDAFSDSLSALSDSAATLDVADVSFTPFLRSDIDSRVSVRKRLSKPSGNGVSLALNDIVRVSIDVTNVTQSTLRDVTFADTLPDIFSIKPNSLQCIGCKLASGDDAIALGSNDFSFVFDSLVLAPAGTIQIVYEATVQLLPGMDITIGDYDVASGLRQNADKLPDILLRPEGASGETLAYLVSDGVRRYRFTTVTPPAMNQPDAVSEITRRSQSSVAEQSNEAAEIFNDFARDSDGDSIPDLFDFFDNRNANNVQAYETDSLIPKAHAQDVNENVIDLSGALNGLKSEVSLVDSTLKNTATSLKRVMGKLLCGGGSCLALPVNASFLTPGMFNVFGVPTGFDPGTPVFWVSPGLPWVGAGYNPASTFRLYISPTLNGSAAIAVCAGPYLSAPCYTYPIPIQQLFGDFCEETNATIQQIAAIPGAITKIGQGVDLGVVNFSGQAGTSKSISDKSIGVEYGVNLGGDFDFTDSKKSNNRSIPPFPSFVANWFQAQGEEIVNSIMDFPDPILYYPDTASIFGAQNDRNKKKLEKRFEKADAKGTFQSIVEGIASIQLFDVQVEDVTIKYPWIEPNLLDAFIAQLNEWLLKALDEIVAMLDSFDLVTCNILDFGLGDKVREEILSKHFNDEEVKAAVVQATKDGVKPEDLNAIAVKKAYELYFNKFKTADDANLKLRYVMAMADIKARELEDKFTRAQSEKSKELSTEQCLSAKFGLSLTLEISDALASVDANLQKLNEYKKLPRVIAGYNDLVGKYLGKVAALISNAFTLTAGWVQENANRAQLWIDAVYSFEEFVLLWENIVNLSANYEESCSLCKNDRFTLKDFLMKFFVVLPDIPVIPFPNWPDIILDVSDIKASVPITIPALRFVPENVVMPKLPQVKLPRLNAFKIDVGFDLGANVVLPSLPIFPDLPKLPDFDFDIPKLPKSHLPVLPYPPKIPKVFDWLLPITDVLKSFFNIVCILNQALIPIDEAKLKTQVENLTARPLSPLLPIDLGLALKAQPKNLTSIFPDYIRISTSLEIKPKFFDQILMHLVQDVVKPFNNVTINLVQRINQAASDVSSRLGQYAQDYSKALEKGADALIDINLEKNVDVDLSGYVLPDQMTVASVSSRAYVDDFALRLAEQKMDDASAILSSSSTLAQLKGIAEQLAQYQSHIHQLTDVAKAEDMLSRIARSGVTENVLASHIQNTVESTPAKVSENISDTRVNTESFTVVNKRTLLAQALPQDSPLLDSQVAGLGLVLRGKYLMDSGRLLKLTSFDGESSNSQAMLILDFDQDGDTDVLHTVGSDIYLKTAYVRNAKPVYHSQLATAKSLTSLLEPSGAVDMFRSAGSSDGSVQSTWYGSPDVRSYLVETRDTIDGFEVAQKPVTYFVTSTTGGENLLSQSFYSVQEKIGNVTVSTYSVSSDKLYPGDIVRTGANSEIIFSANDVRFHVNENSAFTLPSFENPEFNLQSGSIDVSSTSDEILRAGVTFTTGEGTVDAKLNRFTFHVPKNTNFDLPGISVSVNRFSKSQSKATLTGAKRTVCKSGAKCNIDTGNIVHSLANQSTLLLNGNEVTLPAGAMYTVVANGVLEVSGGQFEIIDTALTESINAYAGTLLLSGDYIDSSGTVEIMSNGKVVNMNASNSLRFAEFNSDVDPLLLMNLTNGHYYSRILSITDNGSSVFGYQEYLHPHERIADALVDSSPEEIPLAIFVTREVSAQSYILDGQNNADVYWDMNVYSDTDGDGDPTNDRDQTGLNANFGPFDTVGLFDVMLNVKSKDFAYQKALRVRVYVPSIEISSDAFALDKTISGKIDPSLANYPVSVLRKRAGVTEKISLDSASGYVGPDEFGKYRTNIQGEFVLQPLTFTDGVRVLGNNRNEMAQILQSNGRIVMNSDYSQELFLKVLPSDEGQALRMVLLNKNNNLIASVYFVPEVDQDVTIDSSNVIYDSTSLRGFVGIRIKSLNSQITATQIPGDEAFYPGGVKLSDSLAEAILFVSTRGDVTFARDGITLREKSYSDPLEPVVFEVLDANSVIAEMYIASNFENVDIVQASQVDTSGTYFDANRNHIVDSWEKAYGLTGTGQEIAEGDLDFDSLTNLEEYKAGTHPYKADTDGDGITDDIEVRGNTDALHESADRHRFNDVADNSVYFNAIQRLYAEGIVQGYPDNTYRPENHITRAELLKIILGTTGCKSCVQPTDEEKNTYDPAVNDPDLNAFNDIVPGESSRGLAYNLAQLPYQLFFHYPDVQVSDWFYYCVEIATAQSIVHGYKGDDDSGNNATGLFLPYEDISRAEAVKVFLESAEFTVLSSQQVYDSTDEQGNSIINGWYYDRELNYIYSGVEYGLLVPDSAGRVYPERKITRGEMALMAYRVLNKLQTLHSEEDFDDDAITNSADSCICLPEDLDSIDDADGCPEAASQLDFTPVPFDSPLNSGVYIVKGEELCQYIEPISDAVSGDDFFAVISDFKDNKVWRESNHIIVP